MIQKINCVISLIILCLGWFVVVLLDRQPKTYETINNIKLINL